MQTLIYTKNHKWQIPWLKTLSNLWYINFTQKNIRGLLFKATYFVKTILMSVF